MIFITGDVHGVLDIGKFFEFADGDGKNLTKKDYVIVTGDFGVIYSHSPNIFENELLKYYNDLPWTTLFVDGNHENFDRLFSDEFKEVKKFSSKVKQINESIFHLQRGHIYTIEDKTFFTMGGAYSIDRAKRVEGYSWWDRELPNTAEYEFGLNNLEKHNFTVDYMLGHNGPKRILDEYIKQFKVSRELSDKWLNEKYDSVTNYFDVLIDMVTFDRMFFGHFHDDWYTQNNKYTMVYDKIIQI